MQSTAGASNLSLSMVSSHPRVARSPIAEKAVNISRDGSGPIQNDSAAVKANCREVYSPLGSEIAVRTLEKYGIKYQINEIIPYIQKADRKEMCPMEKLSLDKSPEEFYEAVIYT